MAKLGFLGLGIMGYPMARNLLQAGHDVGLWSHTAAKAKQLAEAAGGRFCSTPAEAAKDAECIFLCVGDGEMSEELILGADGVSKGAKQGAVIADASTVSPSSSRKIGEKLASMGFHFLDAPCTGSKPGAEGGNLTFMIGGDQQVFERVRPYFEPMGKKLYYCGGSGMGLNAKLTQNLILSNILQAFNEGMVLASKAGVDPDLMLDILDNSAAKSGLISFKAPYVLRRDFSTNFSVKWMHKDIGLMLESANELQVPLPLTGLTQQMFRAAIAKGYGEEDICSTIKVLEEISGVEVRKR
ncbi:MAG TPA: NAD(P)-dependent oxidoreductase [Bryobacteraceae bacterium]|nr:NAD(P)-dependent oxidoreductase [Bryobacteraceae bacterium]